ncbi:MAG: universal stress protein [Tissierellaceae bacterium]|nr:universal stress protein [Tissierellaceae bacterium]
MKKLLVPIDGSKNSINAMLKARKMGEVLGSEITILNVIPAMQDYKYVHNKDLYKEIERSVLSDSKLLLENSMRYFEDFPGKVNSVFKRGDPVEEIVKYAEEGEFDLVVMGSRGLGAFSRTLLGSVSDKVIHHINTSVLIVK